LRDSLVASRLCGFIRLADADLPLKSALPGMGSHPTDGFASPRQKGNKINTGPEKCQSSSVPREKVSRG
jgi:hypothetical protein